MEPLGNMELRWKWKTVIAEDIDEALSVLANMVWVFQRILSGQFSNLDDEAAFQAELYKNIYPETARGIIAATHRHNRVIRNISDRIHDSIWNKSYVWLN